MSDAVGALTEKEKEALRLLLAGHDAKSSARELDISVHTLNDRLRSARRKLDVTSSREAARVLGEAENLVPKTLVHKPLGVSDSGGLAADESTADHEQRDNPSAVWRHKGALIMTSVIAIAAIAIAVTTTSAPPQTQDDAGAEFTQTSTQSESSALAWLALTDAGDHETSLANGAQALRDQYSEAIWELGIALHRQAGSVESRFLTSVIATGEIANLGDGDFEVLVFQTDFSNRANARETVIMQREAGQWKVADYDIEFSEGS